eukprot:TRINITY_DN1416_c0_g1_i1.p1 TRINITY_DN1416_c0_g1~~TRINITY_DN1416_c0_g1_i1.p1  ORF type:complete len:972 (-),score=163.08 TRINITY_DN1416_c0_g1_i1:199-3114(-)
MANIMVSLFLPVAASAHLSGVLHPKVDVLSIEDIRSAPVDMLPSADYDGMMFAGGMRINGTTSWVARVCTQGCVNAPFDSQVIVGHVKEDFVSKTRLWTQGKQVPVSYGHHGACTGPEDPRLDAVEGKRFFLANINTDRSDSQCHRVTKKQVFVPIDEEAGAQCIIQVDEKNFDQCSDEKNWVPLVPQGSSTVFFVYSLVPFQVMSLDRQSCKARSLQSGGFRPADFSNVRSSTRYVHGVQVPEGSIYWSVGHTAPMEYGTILTAVLAVGVGDDVEFELLGTSCVIEIPGLVTSNDLFAYANSILSFDSEADLAEVTFHIDDRANKVVTLRGVGSWLEKAYLSWKEGASFTCSELRKQQVTSFRILSSTNSSNSSSNSSSFSPAMVKGGDICAGAPTSMQDGPKVWVGMSEGKTCTADDLQSAPERFVTVEVMEAYLIDDTDINGTLYAANSSLIKALSSEHNELKFQEPDLKQVDNFQYGQFSFGVGIGDRTEGEAFGYVGMSSALATRGNVSTAANEFAVIVPDGAFELVDLCISPTLPVGPNENCGPPVSISEGFFKYSLFGYGAGSRYSSFVNTKLWLAVRTKVDFSNMGIVFADGLTFNNGVPAADVCDGSVQVESIEFNGTTHMGFSFPQYFNYGVVGASIEKKGSEKVQIRCVSDGSDSYIYVDYLFKMTEDGLKQPGGYFVYDPTVGANILPSSTPSTTPPPTTSTTSTTTTTTTSTTTPPPTSTTLRVPSTTSTTTTLAPPPPKTPTPSPPPSAAAAVVIISGKAQLVVPNATAFCNDPKAVQAFQTTIAAQANVSVADVNASCSVVNIATSSARRLQTIEAAELAYAISVRGNDAAAVQAAGSQIVSKMKTIKSEELAESIQKEIVAAGGESYTIEVRSFLPDDDFTIETWPSTTNTTTESAPSPPSPPSPSTSGPAAGTSATTTSASGSKLGDGTAEDNGSDQMSAISSMLISILLLLSQ